jgi:hypothetical protein
MIVWDPIAPGELLLGQINWGLRLAGDTIASSVWSASNPAGLTLTPAVPTFINSPGNYTQIWTSTPVLGVTYLITNTITTGAGSIEIETVQMTCALK